MIVMAASFAPKRCTSLRSAGRTGIRSRATSRGPCTGSGVVSCEDLMLMMRALSLSTSLSLSVVKGKGRKV